MTMWLTVALLCASDKFHASRSLPGALIDADPRVLVGNATRTLLLRRGMADNTWLRDHVNSVAKRDQT